MCTEKGKLFDFITDIESKEKTCQISKNQTKIKYLIEFRHKISVAFKKFYTKKFPNKITNITKPCFIRKKDKWPLSHIFFC